MQKTITRAYMALVYIFLYAPLAVLALFSFNSAKSRNVWHGFSLRWYRQLFADTEILHALLNTFIIAATAAAISSIIGTSAAFGISRMKKKSRRLAMSLNSLPMVNPEIVTGVSVMLLFVLAHKFLPAINFGMGTLVLAHTTFCLPYVVLSVLPKLQQMNPYLYEAAQDLGLPPFFAFFKAILPEIFPGVVTGLVMAFTLSLDDFIISYFVSGSTNTLPIAIYSMTRRVVSPEINALSTLLFAVVLGFLLLINSRQAKEGQNKSIFY